MPAEEKPHVLVVDDDKRLRELLRKYLVEQGFLVTAAGDAGEARERLASFAFDLLIVDVMMPGESGLELTADLRRSSRVPRCAAMPTRRQGASAVSRAPRRRTIEYGVGPWRSRSSWRALAR